MNNSRNYITMPAFKGMANIFPMIFVFIFDHRGALHV